MRRALMVMAVAAVVAVALGWFIAARMPRWFSTSESTVITPAPPPPPQTERRIQARLFYVSESGTQLVGVERDVPFADNTEDQARAILDEQLKPAPPPLGSPLPMGTTVRGVFLTDRGDAFVDLSREATSAHSGGSLDEIISVYAIVNVITVNLPAIERVQILVDGKEVDSLAGHVDLRRPLPRNLTWVAPPPASTRPDAEEPAPHGTDSTNDQG